jgi:hypothetical protein
MWTRIIKVEKLDEGQLKVFAIEEDASHEYQVPSSLLK